VDRHRRGVRARARADRIAAARRIVVATPSFSSPSPSPSASVGALPPREIGPFEIPLSSSSARKVYFVVPHDRSVHRLLASLHGVCNPPGYTCGHWVHAASDLGFLVCPEGNARCGHDMFDAPTWTSSPAQIDDDLETAIAAVEAQHAGDVDRDGAVLTGFSKGAYVAVQIAQRHPGRWPYLLLNEADVSLTTAQLRAAKVRAVALFAGERGGQIGGMRATATRLAREGFAARLWVMKDAGHHYSADIDAQMHEAIDWLVAAHESESK
jgi:predicted esterase